MCLTINHLLLSIPSPYQHGRTQQMKTRPLELKLVTTDNELGVSGGKDENAASEVLKSNKISLLQE